jgi:hypothetical protein
MKKIKVRNAKAAMQGMLKTMSVDLTGDKVDIDNKKTQPGSHFSVKVKDVDYKYYPWGINNNRPNELLTLLRSNGDMENLLSTKTDFLVGAGLGLFEEKVDGKDLVLVPQVKTGLREWMLEKDINGFADEWYTNLVTLGNALTNVDISKDLDLTLRGFDASTMRIVMPKVGTVEKEKKFLVSSNWHTSGQKYAKTIKEFDYSLVKDLTEAKAMDFFIHTKPKQPGQFWYGFASWSAMAEIIRLANRIPVFHNESLDTEGNIGYIMHIAKKYFEDLVGLYEKEDGEPFTIDELIQEFDLETDAFLFGDGKRKVLRDVCEINPATNELVKLMEVENVKRNNTGKEYIELGTWAVNAMSNGSGVLNGLSGVSDGKMNSSGGTEIRISAEYQQFYRTPRQREMFLRILNLIYVPILKKKNMIGDNVYFHHKNILLETLDKNKSGSSEKVGNS